VNKYLTKISQMVSTETKKDIVNTGVIGTLGGVAGMASHSILTRGSHTAEAAAHAGPSKGKVFAVGTGLGLLADYAGLKLKPHVDKVVDKMDKQL
jgi:hypothetical protein